MKYCSKLCQKSVKTMTYAIILKDESKATNPIFLKQHVTKKDKKMKNIYPCFSESIWASCHCCRAVLTSALAIALSVSEATDNWLLFPLPPPLFSVAVTSGLLMAMAFMDRVAISERVRIIKAPFVITLFCWDADCATLGGFGGPIIGTYFA